MRRCLSLLIVLVFTGTRSATAQQAGADTTALKRGYHLFRPVPQELLRDFTPDRPGVTESAHTVDAGHFQLEMDVARFRDERDADQRQRTLHLADAELRVGLARCTDLHVGFESFLRERAGQSGQNTTTRGVGDLTVRLKQNLLGNDAPHHAAVAVSAYVRAPTGGQQGAGGWETGLTVPVEYDFSESFDMEAQVVGELGYDRDRAVTERHVNASAVLDYCFGPAHRLEVFAEGAGFWNVSQHTWLATANVGPALYLTSELRLDAGLHLPLTRQPSTREVFLGLSARW